MKEKAIADLSAAAFLDQTLRIRPSCCRAVTPSSRPISSAILPSLTRSTVVPVKCIFRPVAAGNDPMRKSLNRTDVCAATLPSANHIVILGDKIGRTPEIQVRKRFAKPGHERLDILAAAARLVQ